MSAARALLVTLAAVLAVSGLASAAPRPIDGQLISMRRLDETAGVRTFRVVYGSDGLAVRGLLLWPCRKGAPAPPDAARSAPAPALSAVVFSHDGVNGISTWTARRARELAAAGYVVFAPSFRGEDGSQGTVEVADGEVDDVLAAARLLSSLPGVAPTRIAAVGMSHGALVSVLAAQRSDVFRCVVAAYGVMDIHAWWAYLRSRGFSTNDALSRRVYGKGPDDRPEAFRVRSAVARAADLRVPLLVLQGTADRIVPPDQARRIEQACAKSGRRCDVRFYEGAQHGFLIYGGSEASDPPAEVRGQREAWRDMLAFLRQNL